MSDLFKSGIRPAVDAYLAKKAAEERDYGDYWSASSAGYCMRKLIFERLKVPHVKEQDARKTRVFEAGHIFHDFIQGITKEAGISIAQEVELQDEDLMIRGHFDDLVLVSEKTDHLYQSDTEALEDLDEDEYKQQTTAQHLILYDYKTQNSRAFTYQKGKGMSYYHEMQLGTYVYILRKLAKKIAELIGRPELEPLIVNLLEARILKISKDDLRMEENQLIWSSELETRVFVYWDTLNTYWQTQKIPPCTCADHEGGFLAREAYNDFFYEDEPCSLKWYNKCKEEGLVK